MTIRTFVSGTVLVLCGTVAPVPHGGGAQGPGAACGACCFERTSTCIICTEGCVVTPDAYDAGKGKCILQT
jgi:hypothetical protein